VNAAEHLDAVRRRRFETHGDDLVPAVMPSERYGRVRIPDDFNAALPQSVLASFEGRRR